MTTSNTCATRRRLPQRRRARREDLPAFRLTARDKQIVAAVYAYEALTPQQVADLFFAKVDTVTTPPPSSRCLHRLKLLYQYGFLEREELPQLLVEGRKPFVYRLTPQGAQLVALQQGIAYEELGWTKRKPVSPLFLDHLITSNDVRVQIVRAVKRHGYRLGLWLDEKTLKQQQTETVTLISRSGRQQTAALVPDGYVHFNRRNEHYRQYIEVDLSNVTGSSPQATRRTWARKVHVYLAYYRVGHYYARYHSRGMRVLTIVKSEQRLANLKAVTEEQGGRSRFWFTTLDDLRGGDVLVDPIWQVAGHQDRRALVW